MRAVFVKCKMRTTNEKMCFCQKEANRLLVNPFLVLMYTYYVGKVHIGILFHAGHLSLFAGFKIRLICEFLCVEKAKKFSIQQFVF